MGNSMSDTPKRAEQMLVILQQLFDSGIEYGKGGEIDRTPEGARQLIEELVEQEIAEAKLSNTYEMMTEYVDWCNDHSSELDDGGGNYVAVKPTFLGFRRFMNDKLEALSQLRGK